MAESSSVGMIERPNIPAANTSGGGLSDIPAAPYPAYTKGGAAPSKPKQALRKFRDRFFERSVYCDAQPRQCDPVLAYVWSAICEIHTYHGPGREQLATGFLISPGVVITAGHVVNSPEAGRAQTAVITPGKFRDWSQWGSLPASRFSPCPGWDPSNPQAEWDYAAIFLDNTAQFGPAGFFRFKAISDAEIQAHERSGGLWTVAGYPADPYCDRSLQPLPYQWYASGPMIPGSEAPMTLNYEMPTSAGQSGSPIYYIENDTPFAIAIHTAGLEKTKWARRIDSPLEQQMERWVESLTS
jgi:glutamyl endopeptidase